MSKIIELKAVTKEQAQEVIALMEEERIVGCASLCLFESPTGRKASIEDVVIQQACRGQHLGKQLMQHVIDYA